jgi:hypothetical protein
VSSSIGPGLQSSRGALRVTAVCAFALVVVGTHAGANTLAVRHDAPACILADTFPRLGATHDPAAAGARVRVAFRPEAATLWHAVTAEVREGVVSAVLPRPRLSAQRLHYRFESVAADASVAASQEYAAPVVADAAACPGAAAETVASATVLVDVPPGAPLVPPVPAGFDPVGAVSNTPHKAPGKRKLGVLAGVVIGGGAVAGGVLAAGAEPPPTTQLLPPSFTIRSVTPPPFGSVSIATTAFVAEVTVVTPRQLAAGEAWVAFYGAGNPPERPCAVVAGNHPALDAGRVGAFTVRSPFIHAVPCGMTTSARIYFRSPSGQTLYQSGLGSESSLLDAAVAYTFVP